MTRAVTGDARAIEPLVSPPRATVVLPGSKSITNRGLVCAALADGVTRIEGALFADDTLAMARAVTVLGAGVEARRSAARFTVSGVAGPPRPASEAAIDARMSGTTGRFTAPVAAAASSEVVIDGHPQLRARPFGDLVEALRHLGARVDSSGAGGLPLRVRGPIGSGPVTVAADRSSQFLSGLMLAGPVLADGLTITLGSAPVSMPYVEMTASVMRSFGARVEIGPAAVRVDGGGYRSPGRYSVEPDASAASYFWAAAAVTGGAVGVRGLSSSSIQGDVGFAEVLESMGATVTTGELGETVVTGGPLRGADIDLRDLSDTAPTLAVTAALARGPTKVTGIGFIRGKESDRIAAPVAELRRCGVDATENADGFTVAPAGKPSGARIRTYDDHRMAMAFSVLGLVVRGVEIENPACVAKTFPAFFDTLEELRVSIPSLGPR